MLLIIAIIIAFVVGFLVTWSVLTEPDPKVLMVLDYLTEKYLSERPFSTKQLASELNMDPKEVEKVLKKLEAAGLLVRFKDKWALKDPLVFLTEKDYQKAMMLTASDNIIYGAYQIPYLSTPLYVISQLVIVLLAVIFCIFGFFNIMGLRDWLTKNLPPSINPELFLLFIVAVAIIIADVLNNFIKIYTREKYSVVVGFRSGILYDISPTDELSGRIPRGRIARIDVDVSLWQKINNFFGAVPIGDVVVWVRGQKEPIRFRSVPYPLQLYYVIRATQLGHLEWRKRHARTIALWRYGYLPWLYRGRR